MLKTAKDQLKIILNEMSGNYSSLQRKLKKFPDIIDAINLAWVYNIPNQSFMELVYNFINNESPICKYGNRKKFIYYSSGYVGCASHCQCVQEKKTKTMLGRYGVKHALQSKKLKAKQEQTLYDTFGTTKLNEVNVKQKQQTNLERYGAKTPLESKEIQKKTRDCLEQRTGYCFPFEDPKIQQNLQVYWGSINGSKSYIKTKKQQVQNHTTLLNNKFPESVDILTSPEKLTSLLESFSRQNIADKIGCSVCLIDKRIKEWRLTQFQKQSSYYEVLIGSFLKENAIEFEKNNRKIIKPKELDFYIPNHNLAIEFNGLRWHSEGFGKKDKNYHLNKTLNCEKQGIRLIHIFQDEMDNSYDIIKSIILNMCGKSKKIGARQCRVEKLTESQSAKFLNQYHLQHNLIGSFARYGLFYQDELISIMTFKKNFTNIEIGRYACKSFLSITGGAERLFKQFIIEYAPEVIYSYCDRRYFTGNIYKRLGFKEESITMPNYWYFCKSNERLHRLNFTKKKLIKEGYDKDKTEWEIMLKKGYDRIWDCGNYRYKWENTNNESNK